MQLEFYLKDEIFTRVWSLAGLVLNDCSKFLTRNRMDTSTCECSELKKDSFVVFVVIHILNSIVTNEEN